MCEREGLLGGRHRGRGGRARGHHPGRRLRDPRLEHPLRRILGAPWCYASVSLINRFERVDDTLDAFGLHGMGGIAGAILTGVFAETDGLVDSGSFALLGKNVAGALAGLAFSAAGTAVIVLAMKTVANIRVPEEGEFSGIDGHTHGETFHSPSKRYLPDVSADTSGSDSSA
ncbi:unnamed protein product [Effrenium voratum]|nr:unnamed protein product [Effrenium voratum]